MSCGVLHVPVANDLVLDAGTWEVGERTDRRPIVRINPPARPMFQQVVEYLERKPVPTGGNFRRDAESRAAVAICLRWGSYFTVLADATRPATSDIDDEHTSHIADDEMARLNVEISSGIAWWINLSGSDEQRYWDLVHRALGYLSTGPKTVRPLEAANGLLACATVEMASHIRSNWPADRLNQTLTLAGSHAVRIIANAITLHAWRNGPVEDVHAGRRAGHELGTRRVRPDAEKSIIRQAQSGLYAGLKAVDFLKYEGPWPPPAKRRLPFLHPLIGPSRWSHTEQSRVIELSLPHSECSLVHVTHTKMQERQLEESNATETRETHRAARVTTDVLRVIRRERAQAHGRQQSLLDRIDNQLRPMAVEQLPG